VQIVFIFLFLVGQRGSICDAWRTLSQELNVKDVFSWT